MPDESRARIAQFQREFVQAVVQGGDPPEGFSGEQIGALAHALVRKRARSVARSWPGLARGLGNRFQSLFRDYAATLPPPTEGGALADGRAFAASLVKTQRLPDEVRLEMLRVDLGFRQGPSGLAPRRMPVLRAILLAESGRLVLALRLPGIGIWTVRVPLGRQRFNRARRPKSANG